MQKKKGSEGSFIALKYLSKVHILIFDELLMLAVSFNIFQYSLALPNFACSSRKGFYLSKSNLARRVVFLKSDLAFAIASRDTESLCNLNMFSFCKNMLDSYRGLVPNRGPIPRSRADCRCGLEPRSAHV